MNGIGSHQSAKMGKDEWLTPPEIIRSLGQFDLDPCAPSIRPWETARKYFTKCDNGLIRSWEGRVWCNPPYGLEATKWLNKLADHGNGIALIFARTETKMFFKQIWNKADAVFFIEGRLFFHHASGKISNHNAGAPSVLVAYGKDNALALQQCSLQGFFINLK